MRCDGAREAISERLDGQHLRGWRAGALEEHLSTCARCRSFEAAAWRLRESSRIALAPAVPDLVEPIMAAVETDAGSAAPRRSRLSVLGSRRPLAATRLLAPLAAALVVGLLAGSLTVGGPWSGPSRGPGIAAADVSRWVAEAASHVDAYEATFAIIEHDPRRADEVRNLTMNVWFRAPERFRLDVVDHTIGLEATPDDIRYIVNGNESYTKSPSPCPVGRCTSRETVVRGRTPFSVAATATDLVVPVTTLVDATELRVLGRKTVLGRSAIGVELPYERARPLFPFLSIGGSWRPFFPGDRVELWLDANDWSPLRYTVFPAGSGVRDEWEMRFGLADEVARHAIFDVMAVEIDRTPPAVAAFRIPDVSNAEDEGAETIPLGQVLERTGIRPAAEIGGLDLYRVTVPGAAASDAQAPTVFTYTSGLSWLNLGETGPTADDSLFERVTVHAEEVALPDGGVGYYEPATQAHGRRVTLHTEDGDVVVETNLPRTDLLEAAAALPDAGLPAPRGWLVRRSSGSVAERVSLEEAIDAAPFDVALPADVPPGYVFASAEIVRIDDSVAVNLYFQHRDAAFLGGPIRLHEELGEELPPASSAEQELVPIGDRVVGRWTPSGYRLEWVDDDVYHSLDAEGASLDQLLAVATSIDRTGDDSG